MKGFWLYIREILERRKKKEIEKSLNKNKQMTYHSLSIEKNDASKIRTHDILQFFQLSQGVVIIDF
jgi:hypothetical protein